MNNKERVLQSTRDNLFEALHGPPSNLSFYKTVKEVCNVSHHCMTYKHFMEGLQGEIEIDIFDTSDDEPNTIDYATTYIPHNTMMELRRSVATRGTFITCIDTNLLDVFDLGSLCSLPTI